MEGISQEARALAGLGGCCLAKLGVLLREQLPTPLLAVSSAEILCFCRNLERERVAFGCVSLAFFNQEEVSE